MDEMQDLLAHLLEGAVGLTEAYWKNLIGPVIALPIVLHPRSNWRINPKVSQRRLRRSRKLRQWSAQLIPMSHRPEQTTC